MELIEKAGERRAKPDLRPANAATVDFHGKAGEFLAIWIVNLLLSIVTLGIYSAWAKVRTNKYFYQNTLIAGRRFDYHATGVQILIGRIIVLIGLVIWSLMSAVPILALIGLPVILVLLPFLLARSLRFNARMTSWSNVRFDFDGSGVGAFLAFMLYPFLTALTLFTTYPFAARARNHYVVNHHLLGNQRFTYDSSVQPIYMALLLAVGWVIAVAIVGYAIAGAIGGGFSALFYDAFQYEDPFAIAIIAMLYIGVLVVGFFPAVAIFQARMRNIVLNHTKLGDDGHQFRSTVKASRMLWIMITNSVAIALSFGLASAWARIRMYRYLADNTFVVPNGSLDSFIDTVDRQATALGDAYADIEGVDIGLPL